MAHRMPRIAAAVALLVVAGVATVTAPDDEEVFGAIDSHGVPGEVVHSRTFDVRVDGVRAGETLDIDDEFRTVDSRTSGVWVVVDATVTWNVSAGALTYTNLRIGEREYRASDIQPVPSLMGAITQAGVPMAGSFVFEVPSSALTDPGAASAQVRPEFGLEPGPDTVPVITLDLAALTVEPSVAPLDAQESGLR